MKMATTPNRAFSNHYRCPALLNLSNLPESPTQQALAVEYAKMGLKIFPCDMTKAPIFDHSLNLLHGLKDSTSDPRIAAKIWYKYPGAAIGFALPKDIIVFDCDVRKDSQKRPLVSNGLLKRIGLESFQKLINDLN